MPFPPPPRGSFMAAASTRCCPFVGVIRFKRARRSALSHSRVSYPVSLLWVGSPVRVCCVRFVRDERRERIDDAAATTTAHTFYLNPYFYVLLLLLCLERPPHPKNINVVAVTLYYYISFSSFVRSFSSPSLPMVPPKYMHNTHYTGCLFRKSFNSYYKPSFDFSIEYFAILTNFP
uniref:Uncharacterized protein n=1 Tax=Sipha flava TaxID=143950 RepID=A0A2S2Q8J4_9HEMI